jgi:mannosylglycerate hydrolase
VVPGKKCENSEPKLVNAPGAMENEFLAVKINPDGSLRIRDKQTGKIYNKLNVIEDTGDVGDGLWHKAPKKNKRITSSNGNAKVSVKHADSFSACYKITVKLKIPTKATLDKTSRGKGSKTLTVTSLVTLQRGSKRVDIVTTFDNQFKDHRLRALFPTGINTNKSHAAGQFDVLSRPLKTPLKKGWAEEQITVHPNYGFVDMNERKIGIAILNEGLTEYEVTDDKKKTIAITLVRSIENICGVDSNDISGGQCLGEIQCRYAIYPHAGDYRKGDVFDQLQQFNLPLETAQCGKKIEDSNSQVSFFRLMPDSLVLSALKQSENGKSVILRFFNPTSRKVTGTLSCFRSIKKAWLTNLNEKQQRALEVKKQNTVVLDVGAKKIITLELALGKR